jgi:quinol-cytochrome oxidoreductase complex cytochrome b subunit
VEPFWPNEIVKMSVVVLCTLAVIMLLAVLPVLLEMIGLHGVGHQEEPANPRGATPIGIKPEWYFLAVYQYLRLMPTQLLGISGKTLGVLSQGVGMGLLVLLPFWYRRRAAERPNGKYRATITAVIVVFLGLTIWGGWPESHGETSQSLMPIGQYLQSHAMFFATLGVVLLVFYILIDHERRAIRRILDGSPSNPAPDQEHRP